MGYQNDEISFKERLQQRLIVGSFIGLWLLALLGVLLRAFPFLPSLPFTYKNLLHGHSHFAFGGWIMPVLLVLVMRIFPDIKETIAFKHWRNLAALILFSAYGMLLTFPVQGYAPLSIAFSMLSIVATVYMAVTIWKATERLEKSVPLSFLKWGLLYACLSAIGPLATGPLVAMGRNGSPVYFDAIYFYLHFQYNGFFTFTVLALLYRLMEKYGLPCNGRKVFLLFNYACFPAYALSVLWSDPTPLFNWIGGIGALMQLAGVIFLLKDIRSSGMENGSLTLQIAVSAFVLKNILQFLSAFPVIAATANQHHNFVIAYLHLVLLGFVTSFVFSQLVQRSRCSRIGIALFLFSFFTTESLLVLNASSGILRMAIPYYSQWLFFCSIFFPVGIGMLLFSLKIIVPVKAVEKQKKTASASVSVSSFHVMLFTGYQKKSSERK